MAYGVVIPVKIAAKDIGALNRSAESSVDQENGNLLSMAAQSTTAGEGEVWTAVRPVTGTINQMWMVYSPEISILENGTKMYRGLTNDPRDFYIPDGYTFDVFKPQVHDILILSEDCLVGSHSTGEYVVATNNDWQLNWSASAVSGLSLKVLEHTTISIPDGSIGTQRVTAYKFEVVAVA